MAVYSEPDSNVIRELKDISNKLRIHSIKSTSASNSGHPTSCSSMAEIMAVLFFHTMRYKVKDPRNPLNDRFILSKGHAAPILYAAWAEAGLFPAEELLNLRKVDCDLEGHPTPRLEFVDVATGSLGQGLSVACGMAYVGKYFDKANYRVYCLVGDGESAEGSVWEALSFASKKKLDNLVAIFDINRLGQSEPTALQHDMDTYKARLESFGFNALVVDGHNVESLCKAFHEAASTTGQPTAILAKTLKGRYFPSIEDHDNWHGKPLGEKTDEVIASLQARITNSGPISLCPLKPAEENLPAVDITDVKLCESPSYELGQKVATRMAYGTALAKLARDNDRVLALDGDTKNSTYSNAMLKVDPERYIECYIAEQNLVGVGIGAACRDRSIVFCSTFGAFFTRTFDQIRMGAISQTNLNCVGSHAGVSIGEDGPSQMALEDFAMFRAVPNSTVFYPSDAVAAERACELAARTKGICFIRTSRPATPVLYGNDHTFEIGKANVIRKSSDDKVLVVAAGVTLIEAMKAADDLAADGVNIRLLDPFTIKPIDKDGIVSNALECNGKIIVVEDHYPEGGIGEAVMAAVAMTKGAVVRHLAVSRVPRSGKAAELMEMFGISASHISAAVQELSAEA